MPIYTYTTLNDPLAGPTGGTGAYGINDAGQIVGSYTRGTPSYSGGSFLYNPEDGTYTALNDPWAYPGGYTFACGINDAGQISGYYFDTAQNRHGFLYNPNGGTYTTLDDPVGTGHTVAYAINHAGQIVGTYDNPTGHGFLYNPQDGTYTTLDDPVAKAEGNLTEALGINDAGQIVGFYQTTTGTHQLHGFLFSGGTYTTLDDPFAGPDGTVATGINNAGQIVGHYYDSAQNIHGFLYDSIRGAYTTLDDPLAPAGGQTVLEGINDAGQIVGYYTDNSGEHGFLASPSPMLSSIAPSASFTQGGSAVTLSPNLSVSDAGSATLASATVSITGGAFAGDGDVLSANTAGTSITASYNSSTETLSLTGVDTLADYQAVLRTVSFTTASQNPTSSGIDPSRTVTWVVSDAIDSSTPATATLGIATPPTLVSDNPLAVEIGATATITSSLLAASDSDNSNAQLTYTVVTGPSFGTLLKNGSTTASFTQADIENGLIAYRENGSRVSSDSFTFYVSDPTGRTTNTAFQFQIFSPPPTLVTDNPLDLEIGATAAITPSVLAASDAHYSNAELTYEVVNGPSFGSLLKNGLTAVSFTQADIDNGLITYRENGSRVSSDSFTFYVSDPTGSRTANTAFQFQIFSPPTGPNPSPPVGTSAEMILQGSTTSPAMAGQYEIYNIGNNAVLAGYRLASLGTDWQFAGLGDFNGAHTSDMLLRNSSTGGFELYDISNNNITNAAFLGMVGMSWQVMGFGNFSSMPGETDMIMQNSNTGGLEVYDISNNQITGATFMGTVGMNWQFSGVGNFSGLGESDMLLRNSNTGGLEVYDIANNAITGAASIGTVGLNWQFSGVGNFSGVPGETDLLLRNINTGGLEVYDINNNQLTGAAFLGTVGLDWQFAGIAPVQAPGASDLVLHNVNTGAFEVYDIANNQITGAAALGSVGLDWQLGGFAADPPTGAMGGADSTAQLMQAMAGLGASGGGAETINTAPLGTDASQPSLLTTPQHA
jgi:probable HAF family extracellular repeat protein